MTARPLAPRLPAPLAPLGEIAANLWFSWNEDARALFARIDPRAEAERRTPAAVLLDAAPERLAELAGDADYRAELQRLHRRMRDELDAPPALEGAGEGPPPLIAYFCCEFGIHESLPLYSGGLGVLAGDHLKAASDLGVPLVGIGLLYREGYFRQVLTADGEQTEEYPESDPERLGLRLERDPDGRPVEVSVDLAGEPVRLQVWRADVGRTPLLLLDADIEGNPPAARTLTGRLYGGDREMRIRQELLLGVGGHRALLALGHAPTVFHMNEGHSAFLAVERLRTLVAAGHDFPAALELVRRGTVFTTHTPVPAGNEVFGIDLVRRYLHGVADELGVTEDELCDLGRLDGSPDVGMTVLALRTSSFANGVSALHGAVSREMWGELWPGRPVDEVPIGSITNGAHALTWLCPELRAALTARGVRPSAPSAAQNWSAAAGIDDAELWSIHAARKRVLTDLTGRALDPEALTIGFSRRFATYKRAALLFSDPDRLARIVGSGDRPVQVLLAGKAHPADLGGKALIASIARASREPGLQGRVAVLEGYDMGLARALVSGVDVWLNTPLRPQEASGTSGMKAAMNGILNLSVLDGWWDEGYAPALGWAIEPAAGMEGDAAEAESLYRLLEDVVVPLFYARDEAGRPAGWIAMMRAAIAAVGQDFSAQRMVEEYVADLYLPAHRAAVAAEATTAI